MRHSSYLVKLDECSGCEVGGKKELVIPSVSDIKRHLTLGNVAVALKPSATVDLLFVALGVRMVVRVEHQTGL